MKNCFKDWSQSNHTENLAALRGNNKGADQHVHPYSLISAFTVKNKFENFREFYFRV